MIPRFTSFGFHATFAVIRLLMASYLVACAQPAEPQAQAQDQTGRLHQSLTLVPNVVRAGDSLTLTLIIRNPTALPVKVVSLYTCYAFLVAKRDGIPVSLRGTDFACGAAVTTFAIGPSDSLVANYALVALLVGADSLPGPGTYSVRTQMNIEDLSDLEVPFSIVE